ncbi:hypothetical protein ACEWPL_005175 [Roseovarius sp. S1116L3]|uniref:hypothetical protein n=1 Tax=Roseovarius roseus TaxID=3342636 RepID=UPI00372C04A1
MDLMVEAAPAPSTARTQKTAFSSRRALRNVAPMTMTQHITSLAHGPRHVLVAARLLLSRL